MSETDSQNYNQIIKYSAALTIVFTSSKLIKTMYILRAVEHCIFSARRTRNNKRHAPDHNSALEKGVEGVLRLQGQHLPRAVTSSSYVCRGEWCWTRCQVWGSNSCRLGTFLSWLHHIFCRGRKGQLRQVLQALAFNW